MQSIDLMTKANNIGKRTAKILFYQTTFLGFSVPIYEKALKKGKEGKKPITTNKERLLSSHLEEKANI